VLTVGNFGFTQAYVWNISEMNFGSIFLEMPFWNSFCDFVNYTM
jgi:hypothetical protein